MARIRQRGTDAGGGREGAGEGGEAAPAYPLAPHAAVSAAAATGGMFFQFAVSVAHDSEKVEPDRNRTVVVICIFAREDDGGASSSSADALCCFTPPLFLLRKARVAHGRKLVYINRIGCGYFRFCRGR